MFSSLIGDVSPVSAACVQKCAMVCIDVDCEYCIAHSWNHPVVSVTETPISRIKEPNIKCANNRAGESTDMVQVGIENVL